MGIPRLLNDPDRYIRRVKGNKFQARPIDQGVRYDLGLFSTPGEARKALQEFWWGRMKDLPRYTKQIRTPLGLRFIGIVPLPVPVCRAGSDSTLPKAITPKAKTPLKCHTTGPFETREEAAAAVDKWIAAMVEQFPKWQKRVTAKERSAS